jgi:hypothetical protein
LALIRFSAAGAGGELAAGKPDEDLGVFLFPVFGESLA